MSNNEVIFMRFRNRADGDEIYLVGCSVEAMKEDAPRFGSFSETEATAETLSHDAVAEAADRRCFSPRTFKSAMRAARNGAGSYYLFG